MKLEERRAYNQQQKKKQVERNAMEVRNIFYGER